MGIVVSVAAGILLALGIGQDDTVIAALGYVVSFFGSVLLLVGIIATGVEIGNRASRDV